MESHAFVYDSDFDKFEEEKYYGAIIYNREHSNFRAFSAEYIKDVESVRKSLENYFLGKKPSVVGSIYTRNNFDKKTYFILLSLFIALMYFYSQQLC